MKKTIALLFLILAFAAATVMGSSGSIGVTYCKLTPNPFSPDKGPISINYTTDSKSASSIKTSIKIYSMAGKLIRTILDKGLRTTGTVNIEAWDGRDSYGKLCLNGRYLLEIEIEDTTGKKHYVYSIALVK
jgi:flagellar hook assembly protein FlgD